MASRAEKLKYAAWTAGVLAVFAFHVLALLRVAGGEDAALEWSILLLIFAPVTVVVVIGGGLAYTLWRRRREAVERLIEEERGRRSEGEAEGPETGPEAL